MVGKKSVLTAAVSMAAAYAAMPYVALWQLSSALCHGNTAKLAAMIDWDSVRKGLKADISEGIVSGVFPGADAKPTQLAANTLPPFGASFISGIAGSVVDRQVTPKHLAEMMKDLAPAGTRGGGFGLPIKAVEYAFFDSPTTFLLTVRCPGQEPGDEPLRVKLAIRYGEWKVVRAWVSQDLIDLANSRT